MGKVLRETDKVLPWHRVLRSDGRIAMPEGSHGWREQSQRLRAEGVYDAAARRRQMQEYEYQKGDGLGGCLCIVVVTVLAVIVYSALFFAWI